MAASCRTVETYGTASYLRHKKAGRTRGRPGSQEEEEGSMTGVQTAESVHVSAIRVRKLRSRYRNRAGGLAGPFRQSVLFYPAEIAVAWRGGT